ncbi:MAG: class I SAM-dependent methyltransferase [Clostridiales Family XIII bacterium]|jgi:SAM-dependent methyltransferase|nr:class I SAM-dependent methyltransferase [Clostridiales Family XIII bacterium]
MIFEWTDEKIEFFARAGAYTGFHRKLAGLILPYMGADEDVIDVGCGLGLIDFELASRVRSITAVDEHPAVIRYMRDRVRARGPRNIFPRIADARVVSGGDWDVVLLSFFGTPDAGLKYMISEAGKRVVIITHGEDTDPVHSLVKPKVKKVFARDMEEFFLAERYAYRKHIVDLDFGQPLRSMEEAVYFLESYSLEQDAEAKRTRLDFLLKRVVETGDATYPYFLPKPKNVAVFAVER